MLEKVVRVDQKPVVCMIQNSPSEEGSMRSRCDHPVRCEAITDYATLLSTVTQVVNNACATLAIVNALGNIQGLQVGDVLGNIFSFGVGMDAWVSDAT